MENANPHHSPETVNDSNNFNVQKTMWSTAATLYIIYGTAISFTSVVNIYVNLFSYLF